MNKKRITFFANGGDTFLRDIIIDLRKDYDVYYFSKGTPEEFFNRLHNSDLAWFEWCDELIAQATKAPKLCKYICRLHSYEMFTPIPSYVDWNRVDRLIFVNDLVRDYCLQKFGIRHDITQIIYNGVNLDKFKIPENKQYNKTVAFIGYINYKKGPELLLQTLKEIYDYDPSFRFNIAGDHQDERIKLYMDSMTRFLPFTIHYDGWVKDIPNYLRDKDYIISTSLFESFQYSLSEGMAQGCVPLVHSWPGAEIFYPTNFLFTFPNECVNIIKWFEKQENKQNVMETIRQHIVDHFSFDQQIAQIRHILYELLGGK